ncbi:MAG: ABC transporter ATP-binding protein [Blautia massiliensis (ex Durand et al. 2017)]|uniref:ABC transporter ATP-binding protein n=1 Tax=Blautia massiliensis (ex Durand et al. 2017) TaxID=1737424 RepID=UPI003990B9FB
MEETSAKVMEMVEMIPVTKAHALEDQEARKMSEQLRKVAEKGLQLDMIQTYFSSISWVAFQIFQVFCLAFTAYIAWKGIIGVGDITLYQTYFSSIVAQIASIVTLLPIIAKGLESVESIGDVLCANDIEDNRRKKKVVDLKGEITFQDVSFTYKGDEKPVLSHLNFKIQPGETVAFAGGSGSGKTTILNLAIGFLKADSGQVLVDGNDLMELDLHSYRKQIAVVPQQSILFTGTLRENITYGSESISEEQLWNVIRAANLEEVVQKLPDGLDTMITEHGEIFPADNGSASPLPCIFTEPKILILDEATSALDSISEKKIQDSIQKLVKGRTTLIVAHRLSTIRNADRIAVIGKGNVLECGAYEELIEKKGAFYRMEKM